MFTIISEFISFAHLFFKIFSIFLCQKNCIRKGGQHCILKNTRKILKTKN